MKQTFALTLILASSAFAQGVVIGPPVFSGSGLNDVTSGGKFTSFPANAIYVATISATGTPDHFTWTKNGGSASSPVAIVPGAIPLSDGVTISFGATTGHTLAAAWTIAAQASGSVAALQFLQAGIGAALRSAEEKARDVTTARDFDNVACQGNPSHDDAPAIQAAIKSFVSVPNAGRFNAGRLYASGGCYIGSTVTVTNMSIQLIGDGWGSALNTNPPHGFWKSMAGLVGSPMLKITNSQGTTVEGIHFIGSVANPPSAAIVMDQQSGTINELNQLKKIYIGEWPAANDPDPGQQFDEGIVFSGLNANNGQDLGEGIWIYGTGIGMEFQHGQYGLNKFSEIEIWNSGTCAVKSGTRVLIDHAFFNASGTADLCGTSGTGGDGNPQFYLNYVGSENSLRFADFSAGGGSSGYLEADNAYFITQNLSTDGQWIYGVTTSSQLSWQGILRNFLLVVLNESAFTTGAATAGSTALTVTSGTGIVNGDFVQCPGLPYHTTVTGSGTAWTLSAAAPVALSNAPCYFFPSTITPPVIDISHNAGQRVRLFICQPCTGFDHTGILWSSFGNTIGLGDFNMIDFTSQQERWIALGNTAFNSTNPDPNTFLLNTVNATHILTPLITGTGTGSGQLEISNSATTFTGVYGAANTVLIDNTGGGASRVLLWDNAGAQGTTIYGNGNTSTFKGPITMNAGTLVASAGTATANATTGITVSTTCTSSSMAFPVTIVCTSTPTDPGHHHTQN